MEGGSVCEKVLLEEQELQDGKTLMIQVMDFVLLLHVKICYFYRLEGGDLVEKVERRGERNYCWVVLDGDNFLKFYYALI